ncbi:MAG: hypothetical protein AVDCRST_MAG42-1851 [uncultured Chthoniobacterales bacterium]|uniref:Uncharacterized protein n=1 Tax=uncultured Chthoniobacterales bacterium TaxID=1836801 RepID=A0A6J4HYA8_9BACT|nr:MAG: hypothetical protein AVDCRST_MAG42-1851 [uncultured Chthoniobacterales bacterium]
MKNKSTYSLLVNADSEEKGRSIFETAVYSTVVLATAMSVWAFASGDVVTPGMGRGDAGNEAGFTIKAQAEQPIVIASRN